MEPPGPPGTAARRRWALLARALRTRRYPAAETASTRHAGGLRLLPAHRTDHANGVCETIYTLGPARLTVREWQQQGVTLEELRDRDNTGNIGMWPAEEVLAWYCTQHPALFRGRRVLELGAGMTGLAGLAAACCGAPAYVVLTDGNPRTVAHLEHNVAANSELLAGRVSTGHLLWGCSSTLPAACPGTFDVVICADCLYFSKHHADLAATLDRWLSPGGMALLLAPQRGGTLQGFVRVVEAGRAQGTWQLQASVQETLGSAVAQAHQRLLGGEGYDPDRHRPWLVMVTR